MTPGNISEGHALVASWRADEDPASLEAPFDLGVVAAANSAASPWNMRAPLLAWLIATMRPATIVEIGSSVPGSLDALGDAVRLLGVSARCLGVAGRTALARTDRRELAAMPLPSTVADRVPFGLREASVEPDRALELAPSSIDLLHVQLSDPSLRRAGDVGRWLDRLSPGAVVVLTGEPVPGSRPWEGIGQRLPSLAVGKAGTSIAQSPIGGRAPLIEALYGNPVALAQLTLLAERGEYRFVVGTEPCSPVELREHLERLGQERRAESESAREALRTVREEIGAALAERAQLAAELAADRARHEADVIAARAQVVEDQQAELDVLAAKVAVTVARSERRVLEIEEVEAQRRAVLELELAAAQQEIRELRASTSWRMTAGLRRASGLARRFARNPTA